MSIELHLAVKSKEVALTVAVLQNGALPPTLYHMSTIFYLSTMSYLVPEVVLLCYMKGLVIFVLVAHHTPWLTASLLMRG